jgi:21S rRNA (uridine2791-2'-O)-methyltransferase
MLSGNYLRSCCTLFGNLFPYSAPAKTVTSRRFASSKRWVERQSKDRFAREARVQGLKSRAAFKLLQINDKYRLFKPGQTVVDLGYAPGSWSQVRNTSLRVAMMTMINNKRG